MDLAHKLIALGLGEVRAVDDPMVIHSAVEEVLLSFTVFNQFSFAVLFA